MARQRETRFESHMSDAEALMWTIERDPMLSSNIATLFICDQVPDLDVLRARMAAACDNMPRLRERVARSIRGIAPPRWVPDPDFRLDYHLNAIALPSGAGTPELLNLAERLVNEPFDPTRPLWKFTIIEGLPQGGAALVTKLHHTLTDGIGALRLSEAYLDIERNPKEEVPLEVAQNGAAPLPSADEHPNEFSTTVTSSVRHMVRRQLGLARRAAAEVAMWDADPARIKRVADQAEGFASTISSQLGIDQVLAGDDSGESSGPSPLWAQRSRNRALVVLSFSAERGLAAAKALGGTFNDFVLAATVIGSKRVHDNHGVDIDHVNTSFVLSTRHDGAAGGNSFAPIPVRLPANFADVTEAFTTTRMVMEQRKESARSDGGFGTELIAGVATALPTSMICEVVRERAARQDFATSNLRGSPVPLYIGGAKVENVYPIGPVAGTAWNLTVITYGDQADVGIMIDRASVIDPDELQREIAAAFDDLIEAAELSNRK